MRLQEKILQDKIAAFKSQNKEKVTVLSTLLGELDRLEPEIINNEKIISDTQVINVVKKLIESNKITNNKNENKYLIKYLPQELTEDELTKIITEKINELENPTMKNIGIIMNHLKSNYPGQYNGKKASEIIRKKMG